MSYWLDKLDEILEQQKKEETPFSVECILGITLAEFARRDIAVEIYSDFLQCNLWLCSNTEMATQMKRDDPQATTYTLDELREIIYLRPKPEELNVIHDAKLVFPNSKIIDSKLNNKNEEKEN